MKKFITFLFTVCLMTVILCLTAFAAEAPAAGDVIAVSGLKKDGTAEFISSHKNHADGWEAAIDYAQNSTQMTTKGYDRIVVDFYADWDASKQGGVFGDSDGDGFQFSTIYVPKNVRITLNLNGHTINRGLTKWEYDGEVMYINTSANVIINNGTITGGYSCNGAGGIHISDKANVTLNNVNVVRNAVEDDDGAGIAVYNGATLTMNGGSISYNVMDTTNSYYPSNGALYVYNATAVLEAVTFAGNVCKRVTTCVAICNVGTMTLNRCTFEKNGHAGDDTIAADATIYTVGTLTMKDCRFKNNGSPAELGGYPAKSTVLYINGEHDISGCKFEENNASAMIYASNTTVTIHDCEFYDNGGEIVLPYGSHYDSTKIYFYNCYFFNNGFGPTSKWTFSGHPFVDLRLYGCVLRNSTFGNKEHIQIHQTTDGMAGSIFGEGSLTMIVALLALVSSGVSIFMIADMKKKLVPATANNEAETEDDE